MADPKAELMRASSYYNRFEKDEAFNFYLSMGGAPTLAQAKAAKWSDEDYRQFTAALEYGRAVKGRTSMGEELATGIGNIEGFDATRTTDDTGVGRISITKARRKEEE